jgi:hypothetical protein
VVGLGLDFDLASMPAGLGTVEGKQGGGCRRVQGKACESNPQWASKHTSFASVSPTLPPDASPELLDMWWGLARRDDVMGATSY